MCDYWRSLDWWVDLFASYTQLATKNNHNALANPHTLQITRAHAKSSQFAYTTSRFLLTDLNSGDSSASVLTSLLSDEYPTTQLHRVESSRVLCYDRRSVGQSVLE
jgi:hypothetical protein